MCAGCPSQKNIDDLEIGQKLKNLAKGFYTGLATNDKDCSLDLVEATDFSSQVVAGTVYRFDAKFKLTCGLEEKEAICKNFKIFQPLPFNCETEESCLELLDKEKIECLPVN